MLGEFGAWAEPTAQIVLPTRKVKALLAYLACHPGQTLGRPKLATLLWGSSGDTQARDSLRQALALLRKTLLQHGCDCLEAGRDTVKLDSASVTTDVERFKCRCIEETFESLMEAVSLYGGRFLNGITLGESDFDEWVDGENAELAELYLNALEDLVFQCVSFKDAERGIPLAIRLLALDHLRETVHRALIQFYLQQGRRGAALKQYQDCVRILRDELGVRPEPETESLNLSIRGSTGNDPLIIPGLCDEDTDAQDEVRSAEPVLQSGTAELPSIAVLPFINLSGDPEQEYFSDGITEDIITALSRLHWFLIIARNTVFAYKGRALDERKVGNELGVRYILEGSVRRGMDRVRVGAQLVDTDSGTNLWAQSYDCKLTDIFAVQDEITAAVASAIEPRLVAAEAIRAQRRSSDNLSAWDLVMKAMSRYWRMTTEDSESAIEMLRTAVNRYPSYGPAHSMLAFAIAASGSVGWITAWPHVEHPESSAELARRAIALDYEDPWARLALGFVAFTQRDTEEAVGELRLAIDLNPNFATAYGYLGWTLAFDGQSKEARDNFEHALRMSPHDPLKAFFNSGTGVTYYFENQFDEAAEWARRAIHLRPDFIAAHRILVAALAQAGKTEETAAAMARLRELQPNLTLAWVKDKVPYTDRAMPHFLEGMRKAGLE